MPWCPDSRGFGTICPSPTDPPDATYCCTIPWNGVSRPSCCAFPVYTGVVIVLPIVAAAGVALLIFLICHCWPDSPMNRRKARIRRTRGKGRGMRGETKGRREGINTLEMERYDREPHR